MNVLAILPGYLEWHYTRALGQIFHVWLDLLWFVVHFFSIPTMLRTFFNPWRRITAERKRAFDLEDVAGVFVINLMSRLIGMLIRIPIICIGCCSVILMLVGVVVFYVFWLVAPATVIGFLVTGVAYLF